MKKFTMLLLCSMGTILNAQERFEIRNPEIIEAIFWGESIPLRDYIQDPNYQEKVIRPERLGYHPKKNWPLHESVNPNALPKGADPAWQKTYPLSRGMKSLEINMAGMGYTSVNPSDPNMDVGPNHIIQMINGSGGTRFQVWDKSGNSLFGPANFSTLFGGSGGGDPIVLYDQLADRWLMSEFGSGNQLFVVISTTSDPMGSWISYSFSTPSFPDYPKYSVWPDAYYVTTNESTPAIYALDRAKMLAGLPMTVQRFATPSYPTIGFQSNTPVALVGTILPPAGTPAMFMRMADDAWAATIPNDRLEIYELSIDFVTPANSVLTGPTFLETDPFDTELNGYLSFSAFPQPNSAIKLDPLREVLMYQVQYRNFGAHQSIVCNHVTDVDGNDRGGIRWYELRKTGNNPWFIYQQGTYSPDADNRWMGAIAINGNGDIGLIYNITSSITYPGIRYTGRKVCDPLGLMTEPETFIANGAAANGSNRYGDYNSLSVDPSNETTFWGTAQYNPASQWSTKIAAFTLTNATCNCYPDSDDDGYGDPDGGTVEPVNNVCPEGYVSNSFDCDDTNSAINPGVPEVCDGVDNNCNGQTDEGLTQAYYFDDDGDGYGTGDPVYACQPPDIDFVLLNGDCNDNNPAIYPGAIEVCNGIDDNCDGIVDFPSTATYASTNIPIAISSSGSPTVTSSLIIGGVIGNITDLNVKDLKILHTWVGDLKATLTSPGGTVFMLFDRPGVPASTYGCNQDNILAIFDDDATLTATDFENTCNLSGSIATYTISGTYKPISALSLLNGTSPNGTWVLTVYDLVSGDGGSIEGWGLEIGTPAMLNTYYVDMDGDGYGDPLNSVELGCTPASGFVLNNLDCNDNDPNVQNPQGNPGVFGNNEWIVYAWNAGGVNSSGGTSWNTNYAGYYVDNSLNINTTSRWSLTGSPSDAIGYTGCTVAEDFHSFSAKRKGFPYGYYRLDVPYHDDEAQLWINGAMVWIHVGCCDSHSNIWTGTLGPNDEVEFRVTEGGGYSVGLLTFIQENTTISNIVVPDGITTCFNAYETIVVAGGGTTVTFESGSNVTLIAGLSIRFLPGFHAENGSMMNAFITTSNAYCGEILLRGSIVQLTEDKDLKAQALIEKSIVAEEKSVKVYPNPNTGQFTIEMKNISNGASIAIYNILGEIIYQSLAMNQTDLKIILSGINKGIYLVKITDQKEQFIQKVIVN